MSRHSRRRSRELSEAFLFGDPDDVGRRRRRRDDRHSGRPHQRRPRYNDDLDWEDEDVDERQRLSAPVEVEDWDRDEDWDFEDDTDDEDDDEDYDRGRDDGYIDVRPEDDR